MDLGVQGLDTAAEELRQVDDPLDARDLQAELLDEGRRAAARDQLGSELAETAGEVLEAALVVGGD